MAKRQQQTDVGIINLGDNLLYLMDKWDLTIDEMARRCDISTRKFCEIIYREPKGLMFSTLRTISNNTGISIADLIDKNLLKGGVSGVTDYRVLLVKMLDRLSDNAVKRIYRFAEYLYIQAEGGTARHERRIQKRAQ